MKKIILTLVCFAALQTTFSQTLFTYGTHPVSKDEFVRAFNKNPNLTSDRQKALREYLNLYINFKLKVQAAIDAGLDKDATQQYELENFRRQVADNIINDEANVKDLVQEAFNRSKKDIHVEQLYIEVPAGTDTISAYKSIHAAYDELNKGKSFGEVAKSYGTGAAVSDLGYITIFTLPYNLENIVYSLKTGTYSAPVKTKLGYHIFRNVEERKPLGSRRVAQIVIAFPPDATQEEKAVAKRKADSVYELVAKGEDFANMAAKVSNDLSSSQNGGELPEFTTGTYSADYENVVFSLKNKGDIARPFGSSHGYHIVKLLEAKPAPDNLEDPAVYAALRDKVTKDERMDVSKKRLIEKKLSLIKYKPVATVKEKDLFVYTDSALARPEVAVVNGIKEGTVIFSFAKQNITAGDWVKYVKGVNSTRVRKDYAQLYREYVNSAADEYYRNHLEDYSADFARQVKEFKEANLLFGIMEKNVWGKANSDTSGLQQYYTAHNGKYTWAPSADAIIVTSNTSELAQQMATALKSNINNWRETTSSKGNDVVADSGRFEQSQLAGAEKSTLTAGMTTAPVKNNNEDTYTFNYIVRVYNEPGQRSFEDARGIVISDYQQVLEDKWLAQLKKKYPVKVNEAVFKTIK